MKDGEVGLAGNDGSCECADSDSVGLVRPENLHF